MLLLILLQKLDVEAANARRPAMFLIHSGVFAAAEAQRPSS
jgi:hypothetical protein